MGTSPSTYWSSIGGDASGLFLKNGPDGLFKPRVGEMKDRSELCNTLL